MKDQEEVKEMSHDRRGTGTQKTLVSPGTEHASNVLLFGFFFVRTYIPSTKKTLSLEEPLFPVQMMVLESNIRSAGLRKVGLCMWPEIHSLFLVA